MSQQEHSKRGSRHRAKQRSEEGAPSSSEGAASAATAGPELSLEDSAPASPPPLQPPLAENDDDDSSSSSGGNSSKKQHHHSHHRSSHHQSKRKHAHKHSSHRRHTHGHLSRHESKSRSVGELPETAEQQAAAATTTTTATPQKTPQKTQQQQQQQQQSVVGGRWVRKALLGSGLQGRTYSGRSVESGGGVVLKDLQMRLVAAAHVPRIRAARPLLQALRHPGVARVLDVCYAHKRLTLVAELVAGGAALPLATLVRDRRAFPEPLVACVAAQCLDALAYLHAQGFAHGAVHAGNVLADPVTGRCVLTDIAPKAIAERQAAVDAAPATVAASDIQGRPYWLAPEVVSLNTAGLLPASDVWALGCTCVELLRGWPPHGDMHPLTALNAVLLGSDAETAMVPAEARSQQCRAFLSACFERQHTRRPDAAQLRRGSAFVRDAAGGTDPEEAVRRTLEQLVAFHTLEPSPPRVPGGGMTFGRAADAGDVASPRGISFSFTDEEAEEAIALAADPLVTLRSAISGVQEQAELAGLLPVLRQCVSAQEFLVSFASGLLEKYAAAKRDLQQLSQRSSVTDNARAKAADVAATFSDRIRIITANITRLQDSLLTYKDGAEKLASLLYGKLSGEAIAGSLCGFLDQMQASSSGSSSSDLRASLSASTSSTSSSTSAASHKWKPTWVVLRDNFLFFFKSGAVGSPTEVVLLQEPHAEPVPEEISRRPHCFRTGGHVFAASSESTANDWIASICSSVRWYEAEDPGILRARSIKRTPEKHKPRVPPLPHMPPELLSASCSAAPTTPTKAASLVRPPIFGMPLADLARWDPASSDPALPALFDVLVSDIISRGRAEQGILRVPGASSDVDSLRERFEKAKSAREVDLAKMKADVHAVAGLMKVWFREMSVPLLPQDPAQKCVSRLAQSASPATSPETVAELRALLAQTPPAHVAVIKRLCELVSAISNNAGINRMTTDNVFTCLVPSLKMPPLLFVRFYENSSALFAL